MRSKNFPLLIWFLLLAFFFEESVRAAEISLSLNEAKQMALAQNESLKAAWEQYRANQARVQQDKAELSPQVGFAWQPATSLGSGGSLRLQSQLVFSYSIPLPNSPERAAALRMAELDAKAAERAWKEAQRQLLWQVEDTYYTLLKAQKLLSASEEGVKRAKAQLDIAQLQEKAGTGTHLDVLRLQVALASSEQNRLSAENNVRKASLALASLLELPPDTVFNLTAPSPPAKLPDLTTALTLVQGRSEIADAEAEVEKAKLNLAHAERQKKAKISLGGGYSWEEGSLTLNVDQQQNLSVNLTASPQDDFFSQSGGSWQVGLEARWDVADGGAKQAAVEEAKSLLAAGQKELSNLKKQLEQEVRKLYWDLEEALARMKTAAANLSTAQEAWRVAKLKFENGVGSASELLDTEVALAQAETEQINASFDYYYKERELLFNLGLEEEGQ